MKNTIVILAVVLFSTLVAPSFASANLIQGSTNTEFGNYTITKADVVVIDNVAYKAWKLHYTATDETYQVLYSPAEDGTCCFLVRNENFEIQYGKTDEGFGVKLVDPAKRQISKRNIMKQIDYDKFVSQLRLTNKEKSEEEYLGLVACFMPHGDQYSARERRGQDCRKQRYDIPYR